MRYAIGWLDRARDYAVRGDYNWLLGRDKLTGQIISYVATSIPSMTAFAPASLLFVAIVVAATAAPVSAQAPSPARDSEYAAIVGPAHVKFDRFERNLAFQYPIVALSAEPRDPSVQFILTVGRKIDENVGEYATLIFITKGEAPKRELGVRIIADDQKADLRLVTPVSVDSGSVAYPVRLAKWNLEALSKSKTVEARLPNGAEVLIPSEVLRAGSAILSALKDSAFVSWARAKAVPPRPIP